MVIFCYIAFLREEGGTAQAVTEGECGILKLV